MKKFLACIIILAIFSGFVFFVGWTEIKVKNSEIGVVTSKTSGLSEQPVESGKFSWYWQFLLPTNASINKFSIVPVNKTKTITGQLPSGDFYKGYDFTYSFTYSISVTCAPESIINLIKLNKISDEKTLEEYLDFSADGIAQLCTNYLLKKLQSNPDFKIESLRREDVLRSINLYEDYPDIELSVLAVTQSKIPDFQLYEQLKNQAINSISMNIIPQQSDIDEQNLNVSEEKNE